MMPESKKENIKRLAVLASGSGSNFEALWKNQQKGFFPGEIVVVITDRPEAGVLTRAKKAGVPSEILAPEKDQTREEYDRRLLEILNRYRIDVVCLAGWMRILSSVVVRPFLGRMLNIHPALLPAYGGRGYYGRKVHEAVLAAGEKETGVTVHFVDEGCDTGPLVMQEKIAVDPFETVETLEKKIHTVEHRLYSEALRKVLCGEMTWETARAARRH